MRAILLLFLALGVGACSTTTQNIKTVDQKQYCYTDQTIVKKDDKNVSSETVLTCSDKPNLNNMGIVQSGIAKNCDYFDYYINLGGRGVWKRGVACYKLDGTWEIVSGHHFN